VKTNKLFVSGKNAAREALLHMPHAVTRVFVAKTFNDHDIHILIKKAGVEVSPLQSGEARADLKGNASSQGIIVQLSLQNILLPFEKFIDSIAITPNTALVLLTGVEDPHNVGAIIRSAAAFGASAVLMPKERQSPITAAVIKASAGMAFQLPLVTIPSPQAVLPMLKKRGFKIYALAAGKQTISEASFPSPAVFVFGNEGLGIEKTIRALCDETLSIPMQKEAESLNVAASAAVALYVWSSKRSA